MRRLALASILLMTTSAATAQTSRGDAWWAHVETLASDDMKGRMTGTADYLRAADYVITQFKALGLEPAGTDGYLQPVALVEQTILADQSRASLKGPGGAIPLVVPDDIIISGGGGPAPAKIDARLVFAGYGLSIPEAGYDDFAGLNLKGKIVVVISGGPTSISGALKSHARSERTKILAARGAAGIIALTTARQTEIPWARRKLLATQPAMYLADAALRDAARPMLGAMLDGEKAEALFAGSGHSFAELSKLADASQPVPTFALKSRLKAEIAAKRSDASSPNIIARLPGSDPALAAENVVVSAHLDGLGVGQPINGDSIYNGALDNASGVASVIEIAKALRAQGAKPRRSILFTIVTAEEKGLLGSRYFASRPSVPKASIVADLNFDMALPIFPLTGVTALGAPESSLGKDAEVVGATMGLPLAPDPLPDRNVFIRSDQYSFIREGVPSLFFKYGFAVGTPEAEVERKWRANVYHSPSDDPQQPVLKDEAVKLNDYVAALTLRVADSDTRPSWNADSFFARFAK